MELKGLAKTNWLLVGRQVSDAVCTRWYELGSGQNLIITYKEV